MKYWRYVKAHQCVSMSRLRICNVRAQFSNAMAKAMPVVVVAASVVVVVVTLMGGTNLADVFIWGEGRLSGTETGTVRDCSDPDEVDEASHWQTACVAANSLFSLHRGSFTAIVNYKYQTGTYMRSIQ